VWSEVVSLSPPYRFHASRYACPECGGPTEKAGGPDHILKVRCQDCDWWDTFDPAADEFAPNELERIDRSVNMATDRD